MHLHLLVDEPEVGVLAEAMKMFKLSVTQQQGRRPFWQKRYYDRNLCTHDDMVEVLRYIHRDPVKRGLVGEPEDLALVELPELRPRRGMPGRSDFEWSREEGRWRPSVPTVDSDGEESLSCKLRLRGSKPMSENPDMGDGCYHFSEL